MGASAEGLVPYGSEGLHLPPRYGVEVDDDACPFLVELQVVVSDGRPRCSEVRFRQRPDGAPVTSESLRAVPLARFLRESTAAYSVWVQYGADGEVMFVQASGRGDMPAHDRAAARRPRRQLTDDLLRQVAEVMAEAPSTPVVAVMRRFGPMSRATASRWRKAALDRFPEQTPPPRQHSKRARKP